MGIDVGSRIRDYEIVAQLRLGGMASLFLARRTGAAGFAKAVAIKVIHPHLAADRAFREMFVDEAKISARIDHPSVVHVEELGQQDGTYFLVMEYVHGVTLSQLIGALTKRGRRLSPSFAVHIAAKVAEGLHAAHETLGDDGAPLGIVHRDVSPQNVLISSRGHVKLIDFGIAKARGRAQQTSTTSLKGKIRYMAPEQAYGRAVDRRTDVYALGIVLWEMLTMQRMFRGDNDLALLDLVRNPVIRPPSELTSGISPQLDAAVMHALAPSMDARTPTGTELRRELAVALPEALALDSAQLADLVVAVLGEELEAERRRIPTGVSVGSASREVPLPASPEPTQALELYTMSDARIAALSPDEQVAQPEQTSPPAVSIAVPMEGGTPQFTPPPAPEARRTPVLALAAGAVALLAVGGAGGWAVLHFTSSPVESAPPIVLPQATSITAPPVLPVTPPVQAPPLGVIAPPVALAPDAGAAHADAHGTRPVHHGHGGGHAAPTGGQDPAPGGNGRPLATSFDE